MAKRKYFDPDGHCIISGFKGVDLHHWKTKGSGGTDGDHNLMPLAHVYHQECHRIGVKSFVYKYSEVKRWLLDNGWTFDVVLDKWVHDKERGK